MNIFALIYCAILLYAIKDYHKAFLLYAVMRIFLNFLIILGNVSGINIVMVEFIDTCFLAFVCLNYINNKFQEKKFVSRNFPLKTVFLICISSMFISSLISVSIFSISPFVSTMKGAYSYFLQFIFVYLLWKELKTLRDIRFIIKGFMVVFIIAIVYGFYERFNDFHNPLKEYAISLNPPEKLEDVWTGDADKRGGVGRVISIFHSGLACGAYAAMAFAFFFYINTWHKKIWNSPIFLKISFMGGLFFLLLFANARGAMLYFAISLLFMLKLKSVLSFSLLLPFFFIAFYGFIEPYIATIKSISNPEDSEIKGSSLVMRVMQFLATIDILKGSPLFGYGALAVPYFQSLRPEVLGMESVWLQLPAKQGVVGIASYLYLYYSMLKLGLGKSKRYIIGSTLAFFVLATTTVGGDLYFQISLILIAFRLELLNNKEGILCKQ